MNKQETQNSSNFLPYSILIIGLIIAYNLTAKYYTFSLYFMWWVDFGGVIDDKYENTALLLGGLALLVNITFIGLVYYRDFKFKTNFKLAIFGLLFSLLMFISFYLINLKLVFEEIPSIFGYMDSSEEYIEDKDKYLELVKEYGFIYDNSYRPFKTLEDSIEALEFASVRNRNSLWYMILSDMGRFGYMKCFKAYPDKTAEVEYLYDYIYQMTKDPENRYLMDETLNGVNYLRFKGSHPLIIEVAEEFYGYALRDDIEITERYKYGMYNKLKEVPGINRRMIFDIYNRKDKYVKDEKGDYYVIKNYYMTNERDTNRWER